MNNISDPFLTFTPTFNRLVEEYKKYKSLVVALDFDNTIFDYHEKGYEFTQIINLIKKCKEIGFKIVIFSGSAKERHLFIHQYCQDLGIFIDGINENVIDWYPDKTLDWTGSKIYYNILLDDRAGLESAYKLLNTLVLAIEENKI